MATADALARGAREDLLRGDKALARRLAGEWLRIQRDLEDRLTRQVARVGAEASLSQQYQQARLEQVIAQARDRAEVYGRWARRGITTEARGAARLGIDVAATSADAATPPSVQVTTLARPGDVVDRALLELEPISRSLETVPAAYAADLQALVTTGLAAGDHPSKTARAISKKMGAPLQHALRVARTEQLRAYRATSAETYRRNADVLSGWVWLSAADESTCPACWAMHGTFHPLEEGLTSHPNCRCTQVPQSRPWSELGRPGLDEPRPVESGEGLFSNLSQDRQRKVLGPGRFAAYRRGHSLASMVRRPQSSLFGPGLGVAPLRELR